ncbi:MAG: CarD family transcriptional regulator [Clostridia bacterium]|nr:CarD family transcriptional regulator [Clostridia bacterium]
MYKANDAVIYGFEGVCIITGKTERIIADKTETYYELKPFYSKNAIVFIPVNNEKLLQKIRPVMPSHEAQSLLDSADSLVSEFVYEDNEISRKQMYRDILHSYDCTKLFHLIKMLHYRKNVLGKKPRLCDERALQDAEKAVSEEIAYSLGRPLADIKNIIHQI